MNGQSKFVNLQRIIILTGIFLLLILFSFNRHHKSKLFSYGAELWSDKAGYFVYLPATFIYGYKSDHFPASMDQKTGMGFRLDSIDNKVKTKYSYGVSLLQLPFFAIAHFISPVFGHSQDGFSFLYQRFIGIAASFYMTIALFFLFLFLRRYIRKGPTILTLMLLFLGTNLIYYTGYESGMSHVYSFFLFSSLLLQSQRISEIKSKKTGWLVAGIIAGLIITVRPINIISIPILLLPAYEDFFRNKNKLVHLACVAVPAIILFVPQVIYWHFISGNFIYYTYGDEGFVNIFNPQILSILFAPDNGLLLYNPIVIFMLAGLLLFRKRAPLHAFFLSLFFILITWLFSSWWCWNYGCGYGSRVYTEYFALFVLPFGLLVQRGIDKKILKATLLPFLVLLMLYNLKLMFTFDYCWSSSHWDWSAFMQILTNSPK